MTKFNLFTFLMTLTLASTAYGKRVIPEKALWLGFEDKTSTAINPINLNDIYDEDRIKVANPEYKYQQIEYFGIDVKKLLKDFFHIDVDGGVASIFNHFVLTEELYVLVRCIDGYTAHLPLSLFRDGKALLATRDEIKRKDMFRSFNNQFTMLEDKQTKELKNPGPYYLVWKDGKYFDKGAWPYQVVAIFITRDINRVKTVQYLDAHHKAYLSGVSTNYLKGVYIE